MKNAVVLMVALAFSGVIFAQQLSDTISIVKNKRFYQHGAQISHSELKLLMREYNESAAFMKKAQAYSTTSTVLYIVGATTVLGGLVIPDIGTKLIVAGTGLGIEVVALIISTGYKPNVKKAIGIYNAKKKAGEKPVTVNLGWGFSNYGIGVFLRF